MEEGRSKRFSLFPVDRATIIYLLVLSLVIIFFRHNQPQWLYYLAFNFSVVVLVLLIIRFLSSPHAKVASFFRHWYPLFIFTLLYEETRNLVHLVFPGFFDPWINNFELALLGNYPTIFLEKFSFPVLNEYFLFAYFSYYFILPVAGIALYFGGKTKEFGKMIFASSVAFYLSYLGFIFLPVEGPRFAISSLHLTQIKGFIFVPLAQWVVKTAGLHGGCMPSSHVAVTLVVFVFAYRHTRKLFYFLGPLILSLFVGTVWGRFHYVSDVLAGILVGLFSLYLAERVESFRSERKKQALKEEDFSLDLVETKLYDK